LRGFPCYCHIQVVYLCVKFICRVEHRVSKYFIYICMMVECSILAHKHTPYSRMLVAVYMYRHCIS
jgi:hypothetical protein